MTEPRDIIADARAWLGSVSGGPDEIEIRVRRQGAEIAGLQAWEHGSHQNTWELMDGLPGDQSGDPGAHYADTSPSDYLGRDCE